MIDLTRLLDERVATGIPETVLGSAQRHIFYLILLLRFNSMQHAGSRSFRFVSTFHFDPISLKENSVFLFKRESLAIRASFACECELSYNHSMSRILIISSVLSILSQPINQNAHISNIQYGFHSNHRRWNWIYVISATV